MNILITAPSLDPKINVNGISSVVQIIVNYNKAHQYFHYLLGRPDRHLNIIKLMLNIIWQIFKFPFFVRKHSIEIVHQNFPFDPKGILRESIINCWCNLLKVPVVLHVHGGIFLMDGTSNVFYKYLSKSILNKSKEVIVLSMCENDALKTNFNFKEGLILCNSIDTDLNLNLNKKVKNSKKTILFLGRIHVSKGVHEIIDAFKLLSKELNFKFILCGEGPLRKVFVHECEKLLGRDFEYRGIVSGNEKLNTIKESDVFILPSLYGEGLPMALLETMAAGLVPIVTDDASMKFVVQHLVNGIRVDKNNPYDLSRKIKEILTDDDLFDRLSENAVKTVRLNYGIENYVTELNKIYNTALNKKNE